MVAGISPNNQPFTGFLQNRLGQTNNEMQQVMQRLSSALRINQAKDDAAGLAVAQRMLGQFNGLNMAERNVMDGASVVGVADAYASNVNDSLLRMQELAVQSASGTYSDADRSLMQQEFSQLQGQVSETLSSAEFNGRPLLSANGSIDIQAGANNETLSIATSDLASSLSGVLDSSFTIDSAANAGSAIGALQTAMNQVADTRASFGASANRLDRAASSLQSIAEAQGAAFGRIMDADFARETSRLASMQILQRSGTAMMGQASGMNAGLVMGLLGR